MDYTRHFTAPTSQRTKARPDQVKNSAGGFTFALDCFAQLRRFLILGSEGGSYYANERKLTFDNVKCVDACIKKDAAQTVSEIVAISKAGRAPKNDPAIFALAYIAKRAPQVDARRAAFAAVGDVCRTGTHLFQFTNACNNLGGWGRGTRTAVANWYLNKPVNKLAHQAVKYQQRDGWSHRDLLRLAHVKGPKTGARADVLQYLAKPDTIEFTKDCHEDLDIIYAAEAAKRAGTVGEIVQLIEEYNLPRECIPTQFLKDTSVWQAMVDRGMPMTALVRNLGKLGSLGMLKPLGGTTKQVINQLTNQEALVRARVHPIQLLVALLTYQQGHGSRGSLRWDVNHQIVQALDDAFYASFGTIEPTGANHLIALDTSGSMTWEGLCGVRALTPLVAGCAMAMVAARTEPNAYILGFASGLKDLKITARDSIDSAVQKAVRNGFGGTDCSLPIVHARDQGLDVDVFVTITDNETWAGREHPYEALKSYRKRYNAGAKSVVVGMTATKFTIADPRDPGSLDVVGFDTATPQAIAEFVRGF